MILDTNAVSALFAGDAVLGELLSAEDRHHLPVIVIGEYRYGLLRSRRRNLFERLLWKLARESIVLSIEETTAEIYSMVRGEQREKARPIPENDLWIAALARQHDLDVVSLDAHFDTVTGIRRLDWSAR